VGLLGDTTSLSHAIASAKRCGPSGTLLTVTPDDVNSPSSIRGACHTFNNEQFPAVADENFFEALRQNSTYVGDGNVQMPLSCSKRVQASVDNPVAVALEFRAIVENMLQILIGCPLDFQLGTNSNQVRTWYFRSNDDKCPRHKGIFGHVNAYFGCVETQARGALHFHVIIWGGITPKLLEQAVRFSSVCKTIEKALDSMYCAEIPSHQHMKHLLRNKMRKSEKGREQLPAHMMCYPCMKHAPSPRAPDNEFEKFMWENLLRTGIHTHTFTCKKPPAGRHRCRGAFCCGFSFSTTPQWLETITEEDQAGIPLSEITPAVCTQPIQPQQSKRKRDYKKQPVPPLDDRIIVWELKRPMLQGLPSLPSQVQAVFEKVDRRNPPFSDPQDSGDTQWNGIDNCLQEAKVLEEGKAFCISKFVETLQEDVNQLGRNANGKFGPCVEEWLSGLEAVNVVRMYKDLSSQLEARNGYIVSTNATRHNAMGSSTNAVLLGNSQQSNGSLFYVVPYLCKNKVAIESCLIALEQAQQHVEKYPSGANDSGTDKRYVQHMFARVVNELSRSIQLSDTQIALSLLNMGTELTSENYKYLGADCCVNFFLHHAHEGLVPCSNDEDPDEDEGFEEGIDTDFPPSDDHSIASCSSEGSRDSVGNVSFASNCEDTADALEAALRHRNRRTPNFGPAPIYKIKARPSDDIEFSDDKGEGDDSGATLAIPLHYPAHWWLRGEDLKDLTVFEHYALVDSNVKLSQQMIDGDDDENADADGDGDGGGKDGDAGEDTASDPAPHSKPGKKRGPKTRRAFRFHKNHPLYHARGQSLRAKQPTLIFNAHPPPPPGPPPEEPTIGATAFEKAEL